MNEYLSERLRTITILNFKYIRYLIFLTLSVGVSIGSFSTAKCQGILTNNPPGTRWMQVNTPGFKVIYPRGFDKEGLRVANVLQHIQGPAAKSMGKLPHKVPIVLQNANVISNGFVTLSPRRSEIYTTPPQDYNFLGTNEWLDFVTLHEYRHIAQFQHSRQGFNRLFYYLFGQNAQAAMAFASAPPWFWEGDATTIETALTHSGRGRIPFFDRIYRSNLMEGLSFDYNKQHLRSFKHWVPNHYVLGYHFVNHLHRKTGNPDIMGDISGRAFRWPFIPFTFANAMKKETGKTMVRNYEEMMVELKEIWGQQQASLTLTPFKTLNRRNHTAFTEYQFPQELEDGRIVTMKSGIGDIQQLVTIDKNGIEESVFTLGIVNGSAMLSVAGNKVVWNEYHFDPRWRIKTYSVIKTYDVTTKKLTVLTRKSRYHGASLSPDGTKIVTTQTDAQHRHTLIILDAVSGEVIKSFPNTENAFLSMPRWSEDGKSIVLLKTVANGKEVVEQPMDSAAEKVLIPATHENIGHPVLSDNYLFYNTAITGIDNIFVMDRSTGQRYQVTSSKYGAYNPMMNKDGLLYYNEHTRDGMDVVKATFAIDNCLPIRKIRTIEDSYYEQSVTHEGNETLLDTVPQVAYPVKKYSKLKGLVNPHSWGPLFTNSLVQWQFGLFSQDILSNVGAAVGYNYNIEDRDGLGFARISYQGFYPIIDLEFIKGKRNSDRGTFLGQPLEFEWKEKGVEVGFRVPLLFTNSKFLRQLQIGNALGLREIDDFESNRSGTSRFVPFNRDNTSLFFRDELSNGKLLSNRFTLSYTRLLKRSLRDLNSKWGQRFRVEHYSTPYGGDFSGSLLAARSDFFFPGLMKHHSLFFNIAHQRRAEGTTTNGFNRESLIQDRYYFNNSIPRPRGFSLPNDEVFTTIRSNYLFPLVYPDFSIGPLLNIKRVKVNAFADYGRGSGQNIFVRSDDTNVFATQDFQIDQFSFGGELLFDINLMRFPTDFEIGVRAVHTDTNGFEIQLLLGNIGL